MPKEKQPPLAVCMSVCVSVDPARKNPFQFIHYDNELLVLAHTHASHSVVSIFSPVRLIRFALLLMKFNVCHSFFNLNGAPTQGRQMRTLEKVSAFLSTALSKHLVTVGAGSVVVSFWMIFRPASTWARTQAFSLLLPCHCTRLFIFCNFSIARFVLFLLLNFAIIRTHAIGICY